MGMGAESLWSVDQISVERNEAVLKLSYNGEPLINENLDEMSDEQLDFVLARFIAEVRKEDGQEYPGKTLYEMIGSIQTKCNFDWQNSFYI